MTVLVNPPQGLASVRTIPYPVPQEGPRFMKRMLVLAAMLMAFNSTSVFAGGWFIISLGQPHAHSDPRAHAAAFVVQVYGCSAREAELTATAEGLVNGERRSIPLKPIRLAGGRDTVLFQGDSRVVQDWPNYTVAIPKQWSEEGTWIVNVIARTPWRSQSALVALNGEGVDRARSRFQEAFTSEDLEESLRAIDNQNR
jgi:hypothetical protein